MSLVISDWTEIAQGDIAILGVPFDENSSFMRGPSKAPPLIIDALNSPSANYFTEGLIDLEKESAVKILGNAEIPDYLSISNPIDRILQVGAIPFSIGGDHSITYPIIKSFHKYYPELTILQFDAHGDLYDSLDGNRYSHACQFARIMEENLASSITQVGIRTITQHQKEQAERFGVEVIDMRSWNRKMKFEIDGPVYISFDMDCLDPAFAPGVSHHEPGGFSTREVLNMIQELDLQLVGMDLVEYNPERDVNGVTAMVAAKIMKELLALLL